MFVPALKFIQSLAGLRSRNPRGSPAPPAVVQGPLREHAAEGGGPVPAPSPAASRARGHRPLAPAFGFDGPLGLTSRTLASDPWGWRSGGWLAPARRAGLPACLPTCPPARRSSLPARLPARQAAAVEELVPCPELKEQIHRFAKDKAPGAAESWEESRWARARRCSSGQESRLWWIRSETGFYVVPGMIFYLEALDG